MSAIEVFQFPATGQRIRALMRDGEPWFVGRDVCVALGVGNVTDTVRSLDDDEYATVPAALVTNEGRPQDYLNIVSESGLYSLILRSRKPEAKAFKRWVTHDVLPSIRATGRYEVVPQRAMPTHPEALRGWAEALERAESAEGKVAELEPSAQAWDTLASAHGDYSVREASFILNRDPAISTGQQRLFQLLRGWKLIDRNDRPYADHARHVTLRARSYEHPVTGEQKTTTQVRITAAGLRYIHRRLGGAQQISA